MAASPLTACKRPLGILVADEAEGALFLQSGRSAALEECTRLSNAAAREKRSELTSDRPGRAFDSHGQGRHHMAEQNDAREESARRFAAELVEQLQKKVEAGDVRDFAVVAAPRFLGLLRKELSRSSLADPVAAVNKDVVRQSPADILRVLTEHAQA